MSVFALTRDYLLHPQEHPVPLDFAEKKTDAEHRVIIASLIHSYIKGRIEHGLDNTGKVQPAHQIAFSLENQASFQTLFCKDVITQIESVYTFYLSEYWQSHVSVDIMWPSPSSIVPSRRRTTTNSIPHPHRPEKPAEGTTLYERFLPSLEQKITLKVASLQNNLQDFHDWHNSDRVNAFWGEKGTMEHHHAYLTRQLEDPHVIPVIAYFDDTAFAYFELYYAKEDAISSHANAADYDRGFHALIGNESYRGPHRVRVWIDSVTHYLFLADERTQRVMLEPRVDNGKFITYLQAQGFCREKDFNFPHKRAALMVMSREKFFETQHGPCT